MTCTTNSIRSVRLFSLLPLFLVCCAESSIADTNPASLHQPHTSPQIRFSRRSLSSQHIPFDKQNPRHQPSVISDNSAHSDTQNHAIANEHSSPENHHENETVADAIDTQQVNAKQQRIDHIETLLKRSRDLYRTILDGRQKKEQAHADFQLSVHRLTQLSDDKEKTHKSRLHIERNIKQFRHQLPLFVRTLNILHRQAGASILEINRLRTSKSNVMHKKAQLQHNFRQRGLESWVQNTLKDSINPLVAGAVIEGTADVVGPMLDGIEKLAEVNADVARRMSLQIRDRVPFVEKPFYSGFVTYAVLLCPLVLVMSIVTKIKRSLTRFTTVHLVMIGNFYFTLLSGGCFVATAIGSVDVLRTFRHANLGLFDLVMVLHGMLYVIHLSFHTVIASKTRSKDATIHTFLLLLVGFHFFVHSYLHAMHNQDPHVDKVAYAAYTAIFAFILYEWIANHLQVSSGKEDTILNNKSISSFVSEPLIGVVIDAAEKEICFPPKRSTFSPPTPIANVFEGGSVPQHPQQENGGMPGNSEEHLQRGRPFVQHNADNNSSASAATGTRTGQRWNFDNPKDV